MNRIRIGFLFILIVISPAQAQSLFYGRWVVQPFPCPSEEASVPSMSITALALQWPGSVCRVRSSYLVNNAWHIATRCADSARDVPVVMRLVDQRLVMDWGGVSLQFRRCP
jgi:hypothetical protein